MILTGTPIKIANLINSLACPIAASRKKSTGEPAFSSNNRMATQSPSIVYERWGNTIDDANEYPRNLIADQRRAAFAAAWHRSPHATGAVRHLCGSGANRQP